MSCARGVVRSRRYAARHRARHGRRAERAAPRERARATAFRAGALRREPWLRAPGAASDFPMPMRSVRARCSAAFSRSTARALSARDAALRGHGRGARRARRARPRASASSPTSPRWLTDPLLEQLGSARAVRVRRERRYPERAQASSAADAARREARRRGARGVHLRGRRGARRAGGAGRRHAVAGRHLRLPRRRRGLAGLGRRRLHRAPAGSSRLARRGARPAHERRRRLDPRCSPPVIGGCAARRFSPRSSGARGANRRRGSSSSCCARASRSRRDRAPPSASSALARTREQLQAVFGELARDSLKSNSEVFLQLARERLGAPAAGRRRRAQGARDGDRIPGAADPRGARPHRGADPEHRARAHRFLRHHQEPDGEPGERPEHCCRARRAIS